MIHVQHASEPGCVLVQVHPTLAGVMHNLALMDLPAKLQPVYAGDDPDAVNLAAEWEAYSALDVSRYRAQDRAVASRLLSVLQQADGQPVSLSYGDAAIVARGLGDVRIGLLQRQETPQDTMPLDALAALQSLLAEHLS